MGLISVSRSTNNSMVLVLNHLPPLHFCLSIEFQMLQTLSHRILERYPIMLVYLSSSLAMMSLLLFTL